MSHTDESPAASGGTDTGAQQRIDELEMRVAFMEDTIDSLNSQLASLTQDFSLARRAMQMMNQRLEQMQSGDAVVKDSSEETPPPHY
ncbi:MAG: SlyX family protein [Pseudomonadota bacterium]|nr:SlyX family protein [Pseudomonadota bacterium]